MLHFVLFFRFLVVFWGALFSTRDLLCRAFFFRSALTAYPIPGSREGAEPHVLFRCGMIMAREDSVCVLV